MREQARKQMVGAVDVVIIGAGQSGLATSWFLTRRSIDHVILERGEVANSWRRERWDSMRALTPNWLNRLPGLAYQGDDPDGYMKSAELADFVTSYATITRAPVRTNTTVNRVARSGDGYVVVTNRGTWSCRAVVIATGGFNKPVVPAVSSGVPRGIRQLTAMDYRNPAQLDDGGVLVVGASATGLQLADEIHASGRPVTLSVGEHVRLPRMYRGRDIQFWMYASGLLDEGLDDIDDVERVRRLPSPQLVGRPDHSTLDINALAHQGVGVVGRLAGVRDGRAQFSGSLRNVFALADLKMNRLLDSIDVWIDSSDCAVSAEPIERFAPTDTGQDPALACKLSDDNIRTIVWATGFRPDYAWLDVPTFDRKGRLFHNGGIATVPGLYVLGLPFLRRRKSSYMHGAEDDARDISEHLIGYLDADAASRRWRMAV